MLSAINYYGGKNVPKIRNTLISIINNIDHQVYVEVFGGGAAVLLNKQPSSHKEVYNDIDHSLYIFFKAISNPILLDKLLKRLKYLPHSRELFKHCYRTYKKHKGIERIWRWYYFNRECFSGLTIKKDGHAFGWSYSTSDIRDSKKWDKSKKSLNRVYNRIKNVTIECLDFRKVIEIYDSPNTLFYLDPPYIHNTRSKGYLKAYVEELSNKDHEELVKLMLNIKGKAILSGYNHEIYKPLEEKGFVRLDVNTILHTRIYKYTKKNFKRVESIWHSPIDEGIFV